MAIKYQVLIIMMLISLSIASQGQDKTKLKKHPPLTNFDDQKPLFKLTGEQLTNTNRFLHFFALTGYREGVAPIKEQFNMNFKAQVDKEQGTHRIKMYNLSITDMLTYGLTNSSEAILEVSDPYKYRYDPKYGSEIEWLRKNAYCYEFLLPVNTLKSMDIVRNHLSYLFKVKCGYQKRLVKTQINHNGVNKEELKEMDVFVITEIN